MRVNLAALVKLTPWGRYFIGIDGGGTRTRAVVAGADLVPLGRGASGPANAATRPLPRVVETVHEAAADALAAAGAGIAIRTASRSGSPASTPFTTDGLSSARSKTFSARGASS